MNIFDSERKINRLKIYPVGDYLFDKFIGLKKGAIKESFCNWSKHYKIVMSFHGYCFYEDKLSKFSNVLRFVRKFQTKKITSNAYVRTTYNSIFIEFYLTHEEYDSILKLPDYKEWFDWATEQQDFVKAKRDAEKYNL